MSRASANELAAQRKVFLDTGNIMSPKDSVANRGGLTCRYDKYVM